VWSALFGPDSTISHSKLILVHLLPAMSHERDGVNPW
jgi:hypothetical protein